MKVQKVSPHYYPKYKIFKNMGNLFLHHSKIFSVMLLVCWSNERAIMSNKLDFYIFQIPDERQ